MKISQYPPVQTERSASPPLSPLIPEDEEKISPNLGKQPKVYPPSPVLTELFKQHPDPFENPDITRLLDLLDVHPGLTAAEVDSKVTSWQIMQTREFKSFMDPNLIWFRDYRLGYEEAVVACRSMLKRMADGHKVNFQAEARGFVEAAIRRPTSEETRFGSDPLPAPFQALVDALKSGLGGVEDLDAIKELVSANGKALWALGKGKLSDTELYKARIAMRLAIREHPFLQQSGNLLAMKEVFDVLESTSRGWEDIEFPGAEEGGLKRILISGFDPFGTNAESNPSGIIAQQLDGQTIQYDGDDIAVVEAVTFPNRYTEFDQGIVERFFAPYVNDKSRDIFMIVTISLDNGATAFTFDRFAANARGGSSDNTGVGLTNPDYEAMIPYDLFRDTYSDIMLSSDLNATLSEFRDKLSLHVKRDLDFPYAPREIVPADYADDVSAETYVSDAGTWYFEVFNQSINSRVNRTLPKPGKSPFIETNAPIAETLLDPLVPKELQIDQDYRSRYGLLQIGENEKGNVTQSQLRDYVDDPITHEDPFVAPPEGQNLYATEGSGGSYFSNEVYYRVSELRKNSGNTSLPNVHVHIPLPTETNPITGLPFGMTGMVDIMKGILAATVHQQMEKSD